MTLFTAGEIADLQDVWASSLDTTCMITHTPQVSDGAGGYGPGTPTTTAYACRVQPAMRRAVELLAAGGVAAINYWDIQLPYDAVVEPSDTIVANGTAYQVEGVTTGRSVNYGLTAICVRGAP